MPRVEVAALYEGRKLLKLRSPGVNPDRLSKGTCVSRLACSGFQHSGELVYVGEKTPEARSSEA
jgi:hypothetical protein